MQIQKSERKPGSGNQTKYIGFWKGELISVNPTGSELQKIYQMDEAPEEEPVYQGTDKNKKDWALLRFIFMEEVQKIPVEYRIFISKEVAEFEKDGVTKSWYINQWGQSQLVADEKDLFSSFTRLQKYNDTDKKWEDVIEDGNPVELNYRKAYKGETALYSLLRKLINQDWRNANQSTDFFIKIDALMRGKVSDISNLIGTDMLQPVVGMIEIAAKDSENGVNYYQNCVDQAWMAGWKIKEANLITGNNTWNRYEDKANGKGKEKEIYEFYQAVKRNKNITEFKYMHEFNADDHQAAGDTPLVHSEGSTGAISDTDYD